MITQKRRFGDIGEEKACEYLSGKGYRILERNYLTKFGEIDIVARKGDVLVFVEVKTARAGSPISPEENLTRNKLKKFQRAVGMYLNVQRIPESQPWQMDSITLVLDRAGNVLSLKHFENINIE